MAQQANDGALGNRSNSRHMWDHHTEITWARVVMNELTGTAQPPGDSSDVWRLRTHHMRQFRFIQLETAESRLLIYHIRRKLLRNMLNSMLGKMKRAQAKFQMCSAHLSECLDITLGTDVRLAADRNSSISNISSCADI